MPLYVPSQLQGRFTYVTSPTSSPTMSVQQVVPGFETSAQIYNLGFFLYDFFAAFHETPAAGLYVLLLDQKVTQNPASSALFTNGDLALVTLGPTTATGQVVMLPEQSSMPEMIIEVMDNAGRRQERRMRGFPFDNGCVAILSTTPGRLTQVPVQSQGARFTARGQVCG